MSITLETKVELMNRLVEVAKLRDFSAFTNTNFTVWEYARQCAEAGKWPTVDEATKSAAEANQEAKQAVHEANVAIVEFNEWVQAQVELEDVPSDWTQINQ